MADARCLVLVALATLTACAERSPPSPDAPRALEPDEIASLSVVWRGRHADLGVWMRLDVASDGVAVKHDRRPRGLARRGTYEGGVTDAQWRALVEQIADVPVRGEHDVATFERLCIATHEGDLHDLAVAEAPDAVDALEELERRLAWHAPTYDVTDDELDDRIVAATFVSSWSDDYGNGDHTTLRIERDGTATVRVVEGEDSEFYGRGRAIPRQIDPIFAFLADQPDLFAATGEYGDVPGVDPPRKFEITIERADGIHVDVSTFGASGPPEIVVAVRAAADLVDEIRWTER